MTKVTVIEFIGDNGVTYVARNADHEEACDGCAFDRTESHPHRTTEECRNAPFCAAPMRVDDRDIIWVVKGE